MVQAHDRLFELEIKDGPLSGDAPEHDRYVVKLTNCSNITWSSLGTSEGKYGLKLGVRLFNVDEIPVAEGPRTQIPFALTPGDTMYVPIELPQSWQADDGFTVHIELVQDELIWWGNPIIISARGT
jgi:hypothetical protein